MELSRSQRKWFLGAAASLALAVLSALLLDALFASWSPVADFSEWGTPVLSERSRATLSETSGKITVTCILPPDAAVALPVGRLLRTFAQASRAVVGASIEIVYVDPRLEVTRSAALMEQGAQGAGLLFRQAHRHVFVPERSLLTVAEEFDPVEAENVIAAALARLSRVDGVAIGWLVGHGEESFDTTDPLTGFSGLRRALENEGCRLRAVNLTHEADGIATIPPDICLLLIVNPRYPITVPERARLSDWLDRGGRLLYALPVNGEAGLGPLLERWGIHVGLRPRIPSRLIDGTFGLADELSPDHVVTRDLAHRATLTMGAPRALMRSMELPAGTEVTPLVRMNVAPLPGAVAQTNEVVTLIAAAERGGRTGEDLAFRPGRMVIAAGSAFAENRYVLNHGSANRDFIVNVVQWLIGVSGSGGRSGANVIRIEQDQREWRKDFVVAAVLIPFFFCGFLWLLTRRRS
ncbi:MAG: Gldg family protein [Kiritimatiellia bacterium]